MTETVHRPTQRRAIHAVVGLAAAVALAAVLYGKKADSGKEAAGECAASTALLARIAPLEKGAVAAAVSSKRAEPMPVLDFQARDGAPTSLAAFRGRVVLLNLWATWCVPCREEMPTLDQLQATLGGPDFEVVAINIDTKRLERVPDFLREANISKLALYSDPRAEAFFRLKTSGKVLGLPTTYLIGRDGCAIATMAGPANWASPDAQALVEAAF